MSTLVSLPPSKSTAITFDTRDVTTATSSTGLGGSAAAGALVASVGSSSLGVGSWVAHAAARSSGSTTSGMGGFIGELRLVGGGLRGLEQAGVQPTGGDELVMVALFDDAALVEHDDQVGVAHGRQP